ncbi:MAG: HAD family acid phosphatase, partial [Candidatus Erginobacter occultus]|nr:HAD family acid phosphatase [Candidatus Erginobacter occultus]
VLAIIVFHWVSSQIQIRRDILYTSRSDEYRYACVGIYNAALDRLQKNVSGIEEPWAVVMDVDDTCLSSAEYRKFKKRWRTLLYRPRWSDWCREGNDPAVPGAVDFTEKVRKLGGKIVLITGRSEELREPTLKNLHKEGFVFDTLLMSKPEISKELWRRKIEKGEAVQDLGALKIVMLIGDSLTDFASDPTDPKHAEKWGRMYFVVPNPMNGSWMRL